MAITIHLRPEIERRLRDEAIRAGFGVEEYLERLAEQAVRAGQGTALSADEWEAAWRAWAASHKSLPTLADDDRDSIYAGRGE